MSNFKWSEQAEAARMLLKLGASPSTVRTDGVSAFGMKYLKSRCSRVACQRPPPMVWSPSSNTTSSTSSSTTTTITTT